MTLELLAQKSPFLLTAVGDFNANPVDTRRRFNVYKTSI